VEQSFGLSPHLTEDQIELYSLGRLDSSDISPLEEHLMICEACRQNLDEARDMSVAMREALSEAKLDGRNEARAGWFAGFSTWIRRPAFGMALAFAVLVLVVGLFSTNRTSYAPTASLQLTAIRGEMPAIVPTRQLDLTLADGPREGGPFRVSVVTAIGASAWSGLAESSPAGVRVTVQQRLSPGDYFVRLYSPDGAMLHEYGFRVRQ
jgi:hypothetical protein